MIQPQHKFIHIGKWRLDVEREMLIDDHFIKHLTKIQFRILYFLATHTEEPVSNHEIVEYAWGEADAASQNTLQVYIHRLRKLIEKDTRNPRYILSIRKHGYMLYRNY